MATLIALERFVPPFRYPLSVVTGWVRSWLEEGRDRSATRLLHVYRAAEIERRASVVPIEAVFGPGDVETQNDRYRRLGLLESC
jgi:predicted naringenin-chalcone synthase